jgi:hypothetical protein
MSSILEESLRGLAALALTIASGSSIACPGAATPPDVVQRFAPGGVVPPGKSACRYEGSQIDIPAVPHPVGNPNPPCTGAVTVRSDDKQVQQALEDLGGTLAVFGKDGVSNTLGLALIGIGAAWPQNLLQSNALCGVSTVVLPTTKRVFHWAAFYVRPAGAKWDKVTVHPVDQPAFGQWDAGEGFYEVSLMKSVDLAGGRTVHGILFRNWEQDSPREPGSKTIKMLVDVFE